MPLNTEASLDKLRKKLFYRFSPEEYGIDLGSEVIHEPNQSYRTVGGLGYKLIGSQLSRVEIIHTGGKGFSIYTFEVIGVGMGYEKLEERSRTAQGCEFKDVDSWLMHALKPQWKPDGSPWYR